MAAGKDLGGGRRGASTSKKNAFCSLVNSLRTGRSPAAAALTLPTVGRPLRVAEQTKPSGQSRSIAHAWRLVHTQPVGVALSRYEATPGSVQGRPIPKH